MQIWAQKDRRFNDLREADESKKRWQDAQKNYAKMVIMTGIGMMLGSLT